MDRLMHHQASQILHPIMGFGCNITGHYGDRTLEAGRTGS
jgi:Fe2+ transport system protein B